MIRENYYGRTNPNHNRVSKPFPNFEANNPSDVFTQKCLCTTQEYFLPLETESSEIEELEIRQKNELSKSRGLSQSHSEILSTGICRDSSSCAQIRQYRIPECSEFMKL